MDKFITRIAKPPPKSVPGGFSRISTDMAREKLQSITETVGSIENNEIQFPRYFNILLQQMSSLFIVLRTMNQRRNVHLFDRVRAAVELQTRQSFTRETLSMIKAFLPEGYIYESYVSDKRKNLPFKMLVQISNDNDQMFEECKAAAKEKMKQIILGEHRKWCVQNGISVPEGITVLHPDFPLQSFDFKKVKQIKEVGWKELSSPPNPEPSIMEAFASSIKKREESIEPEVQKRANEFMQQNKVSYTGNRLRIYADVIKKDLKKEVYNTIFGAEAEKKENDSFKLRLADIIQTTFLLKKKTALPINDLVTAVKNNDEFYNHNDVSIQKMIEGIANNSAGYFKTQQFSSGKYIQMPDKNKSFNDAKISILGCVL